MSCSGSSMQNVTIHTGDDARLLVNFVDCAGQPVDITGASLTYTQSARSGGADVVTLATPTDIVIANDGESAAIYLTPTETGVSDARRFHKLVLVDADSHTITVMTGIALFLTSALTSCETLTARIDTDLFVPGESSSFFMFDFSVASNSENILFLFDEVL